MAEVKKTCPLCGQAAVWPGWGPDAFSLCQGCGSAQLPSAALAAEVKEDYDQDYFCGTGASGVNYEEAWPQFTLISRQRLDFLNSLAPRRSQEKPRLLELGCALGNFMVEAEAQGWQTCGLEISAFAAEKARQRLGDKVIRGSLEATPDAWREFDAVCVFHVLEHLDDPVAAVKTMASLLAPGGLMVIEVPDFGSRRALKLRDKWKYFLPGEHLHYYTRAGLQALLKQAGLEVVAVQATSFTRLLGGVDKAGLKKIKTAILRWIKWLAWIKKIVLWLKGISGGHDCVLVAGRKPLAESSRP